MIGPLKYRSVCLLLVVVAYTQMMSCKKEKKFVVPGLAGR